MKNSKSNLELISVEEANDFVGIKIEDSKVQIFFPKTLRLSEENHKLTLKFLKSIHLATETIENMYQSNKGSSNSFPIDSYLWIIRDYLENGYFYNTDKQYSKNNGKNDWKKTLENSPLYSNGNIIYTDIITSKMSPTNDMIAKIFRICLKLSADRIGWLFGYDFNVESEQSSSVVEMIYVTQKYLNDTFDDVKRIRYKHMISILTAVNDNNISNNSFTYGIENYYYVFEKMVDEFFDGLDDKKKYNPQGHWMFNKALHPIDSSNLRPDTVFERNGIVYIFDAKMYKYGHSGLAKDLPETQSMQKQITYGDYISTISGKEKKVRNAFIIPYDKELSVFRNNKELVKIKDENLVYIGYAYVDWRDETNQKPYDNIYTFLIDMTYLLENYSKTNTYITELCDNIEDLLTT